jgi:DNA-binding response OmpR family regulator
MSALILVVDDEPDLREALAEYLMAHNYVVLTASDGLEAKKILLNQKVDLILTDMRMPNMNGMELLKFTCALPNSPKVIMITGYSDYTSDDFMKHGASGFLNKPFEVGELLKMVKELATRPH